MIKKLVEQIIDLYNARKTINEIFNCETLYEEKMIQLITELLAETSITDTEYEYLKERLKFFGVKDYQIFEIISIALKEPK